MTIVSKLVAMVGQAVLWKVGSLSIACRVVDARSAFGRVDYQIQPMAGSGLQWVSAETCERAASTRPVVLSDAQLSDPALKIGGAS